jgi:hypothetical protein
MTDVIIFQCHIIILIEGWVGYCIVTLHGEEIICYAWGNISLTMHIENHPQGNTDVILGVGFLSRGGGEVFFI